ncbi:hypothetical protein MsAg5_01810 [Methanosarcinaceae archaeon Ag5]|uniref:MBL fold metallo-hydrolase n=1 Tax=Methanolapillus africanus TaxID=3028297 RepID=A0AAE4SCG7_9EURY|nr:hypothetical protein [Methanosarcinaceae archaeon Ag5]
MKKNDFKSINLGKGAMNIYDFGNVKLHAYKTNDFITDEVFLIEKSGKMIVVESPCFFDNIKELADYINTLNVQVEGKLLSYHMAGATFLPNVPVYATKNADEYGHTGGGKALIDNFAGAFGPIFDPSIPAVTHYLKDGPATIAGIQVNIIPTPEGFDIELPEINAVYTHMLGHDCHSIVGGAGHADALIGQLNGFKKAGFDLILTSHYTPEDLKDVETKVKYLEDLKETASKYESAEEFKAAVQKKYPEYAGENYLDMTAGFFFPN